MILLKLKRGKSTAISSITSYLHYPQVLNVLTRNRSEKHVLV
nr:MAG TPA: hypothetical protein [Caudoviricetes sp.]